MARFWRILAALLALIWAAPSLADGVEDARPSVVRVIAVIEVPGGVRYGTGSGFAISPTRIVTNAHVVEMVYNASGPSGIGIVPGNTRKRIGARIVAYDPARDLAVLEVQGARFTPLKVYGGAFRDGSDVVALGYPGNVDELTDATVIEPQAAVRAGGNFSNMSRIDGVEVMLHTAQIAHGNSGGPLVDQCGRVLGVNTFVTRNERGDASFGFAISSSELRAFLKRNGQSAGVVDDECVPPEVAEARKLAEQAKADQEKARAEMEAKARADAERQQQLALIQEERDNRMALSALLLVLAALAGAYGLMAQHRQDPENPQPWKARIGLAGAAVLIVIAAAAFLTRPSLSDPVFPAAAPAASEEPDTASEATADAASAEPARKISCTIDEGRSEYYAADPAPVALSISEGGCVNGRTQYAASGDGAWQRVAVPKEENVVSRLTFDPKAMTYTQERWLPDAETMAAARAAKDKLPSQSCDLPEAGRKQLADAQRKITSGMSSAPDERLVFRCKAG